MTLNGKTALVTGAASGIGRAIAQSYAGAGAFVICADLQADVVQATAEAICSSGGQAIAMACDVTQDADIAALMALAQAERGGLDILVNAAGIMRAQPVLETTRASMQALFDVNVFALLFLSQAAAKLMIAGGRGGRIINLASIAGRQGSAGTLQYCASKAAVISLTQSCAQGLAPHGITVNALAPGYIQTAMWREVQGLFTADASGVTAEQFDAHLAATVAAGRLGYPGDVAGVALFLASDDAAYVVGQTINVDGGVCFN